MTFNSPSEPGFLTSIEVAVYDQCLDGQANTAAESGRAIAPGPIHTPPTGDARLGCHLDSIAVEKQSRI